MLCHILDCFCRYGIVSCVSGYFVTVWLAACAACFQTLQEASDTLGAEVTALCSEVSGHYEHGSPRDVAAKVGLGRL